MVLIVSNLFQDPLLGIIPRCVNHLFDELRIQKVEFTMRVSFLELYNEELFDLLSAHDDMSKLRYVVLPSLPRIKDNFIFIINLGNMGI